MGLILMIHSNTVTPASLFHHNLILARLQRTQTIPLPGSLFEYAFILCRFAKIDSIYSDIDNINFDYTFQPSSFTNPFAMHKINACLFTNL
jgi:hypothetical protein